MKIYLFFLVLVTTIVYNEARSYRTNGNELARTKERENRLELAKIVRILNGHTDVEGNLKNGVAARFHINPKKLVKVLEKKYPHKFSSSGPPIRFHYIKNPQVLEEFVKNLRKDSTSSSSDSDNDDDRDEGNDVEADVRRNARFRIQGESEYTPRDRIENDDNDDDGKNFPQSIESEVTPFKQHFADSSVKKNSETDHKSPYGNAATNRFKVESKHGIRDSIVLEKTPKSAWDVEKGDKHYNDRDRADTDENRVRPDKRKVKVSIEENDLMNKRPQRLQRKKIVGQSKREKELGDSGENWSRKKKTLKVWTIGRNSDEPKPKREREDWRNKKTDIGDAENNDWDKVGREWSKGKNGKVENERLAKYKQKPKIDYQEEVYAKPKYVARIPEYHKPQGRQGTFHGRTPIPFVGKKNIYEDK